mgnify:CR=1 FL=1
MPTPPVRTKASVTTISFRFSRIRRRFAMIHNSSYYERTPNIVDRNAGTFGSRSGHHELFTEFHSLNLLSRIRSAGIIDRSAAGLFASPALLNRFVTAGNKFQVAIHHGSVSRTDSSIDRIVGVWKPPQLVVGAGSDRVPECDAQPDTAVLTFGDGACPKSLSMCLSKQFRCSSQV